MSDFLVYALSENDEEFAIEFESFSGAARALLDDWTPEEIIDRGYYIEEIHMPYTREQAERRFYPHLTAMSVMWQTKGWNR